MQMSMFEQHVSSTSVKAPTIIVKKVNADYIATRFQQIGNKQRFNIVLGRFRYDFPLADCQEIDNQPWWAVAASQYSSVEEFAKRNGLQVIEE